MSGHLRSLALGLAVAGALLAACAGTESGFYCPTSGFDGDDCRQRIVNASCEDGGVDERGSADAGTLQLCCEWFNCSASPYPELD